MKVYIYARKFARALIEVEANKDQLASELVQLGADWEVLNTYIPMYLSDQEKSERIDQLGVMPVVKKLILELSRSGMMRLLPRIADEVVALNHQVNHSVVAKVTTKRSLTADEQAMLTRVLHTRHQKEITLDEYVDPNVIDGLKVEVDYHVFDDTVATKLDTLIQKLSYEMEVV